MEETVHGGILASFGKRKETVHGFILTDFGKCKEIKCQICNYGKFGIQEKNYQRVNLTNFKWEENVNGGFLPISGLHAILAIFENQNKQSNPPTRTDSFTFEPADAVSNTPYQNVAEFMQRCVLRYTTLHNQNLDPPTAILPFYSPNT